MTATVVIEEVTHLAEDAQRLVGSVLETPQPGFQDDAHNIPLIGWVVPHEQSPQAMEIVYSGTVLARFNFDDQRPDLEEAFPSVPHARSCGFRHAVSTLGLGAAFEFVLRVELVDSVTIPLFVVRGRRERIQLPQDATLQPLMLSNMGRSGSTWVTQLLGQHPQIVTYRPFQYEPRIASYWIEVVHGLAKPASYRQALDPEVLDDLWWVGRNRSTPPPTLDAEPELHHAVEKTGIEELAAFGRDRIERFYQVVARTQEKADARYFMERFYGTDPMAPSIAAELYAEAREIFLIRDFRDVLCSIRSYNEKTGLHQFGRNPEQDEEEYIRGYFGANVRELAARWHQRRDSAYLLRYEDLVTRPEETLMKLLTYVGLDARPSTVNLTLDAALHDRLERQRQHMTTSDVRASIGRWRRDMNGEMLVACAESFGEVLRGFGYEDG